MMGMWMLVALAIGARRSAGQGGAALRARLDAIYGEPHELAAVDPTSFLEADHEFYDRAKRELEAKGYRMLGDVEDKTLSRIYPQNRTFLRLMIDGGQMIRANLYHLHPRGVVISLLQLVQLWPRHLRVVELTSELAGQFIVTSNTSGVDRLEPPAEAKVERLPLATSVVDVTKRHEQRLTELLRAHPDRFPRSYANLDDVLASIARAHVAMARHRQALGGLSRDELERLKGRPLTPAEEAFLQEVQRKDEPKPTSG